MDFGTASLGNANNITLPDFFDASCVFCFTASKFSYGLRLQFGRPIENVVHFLSERDTKHILYFFSSNRASFFSFQWALSAQSFTPSSIRIPYKFRLRLCPKIYKVQMVFTFFWGGWGCRPVPRFVLFTLRPYFPLSTGFFTAAPTLPTRQATKEPLPSATILPGWLLRLSRPALTEYFSFFLSCGGGVILPHILHTYNLFMCHYFLKDKRRLASIFKYSFFVGYRCELASSMCRYRSGKSCKRCLWRHSRLSRECQPDGSHPVTFRHSVRSPNRGKWRFLTITFLFLSAPSQAANWG